MVELLPPLTAPAYEALKADIAKRGVLVPIEVDEETGVVLDGHHRLRACSELGLPPPSAIKRRLPDDRARQEHALVLNMLRRQMGPVTWGNAFAKLLRVRGIPTGWGKVNQHTRASTTIIEAAGELGVSYQTARWRLRVSEALADTPDLAEKVDVGEMAVSRALRVKRERNARVRGDGATGDALPTGTDIRHGDFRSVLADITGGSVALVFTDAPYGKEWLPRWSELGALAARILRPGGLLVAYSGQRYLPQVITALQQHLMYVWLGALFLPGHHAQVYDLHIRNTVKPLLFFANPPFEAGEWFSDSYVSEGEDKDSHDWQQSLGAARYYIERLTKPGDLVADPLLGSGTTALAARDLERRFVGCDVDEEALQTARRRLGG